MYSLHQINNNLHLRGPVSGNWKHHGPHPQMIRYSCYSPYLPPPTCPYCLHDGYLTTVIFPLECPFSLDGCAYHNRASKTPATARAGVFKAKHIKPSYGHLLGCLASQEVESLNTRQICGVRLVWVAKVTTWCVEQFSDRCQFFSYFDSR